MKLSAGGMFSHLLKRLRPTRLEALATTLLVAVGAVLLWFYFNPSQDGIAFGSVKKIPQGMGDEYTSYFEGFPDDCVFAVKYRRSVSGKDVFVTGCEINGQVRAWLNASEAGLYFDAPGEQPTTWDRVGDLTESENLISIPDELFPPCFQRTDFEKPEWCYRRGGFDVQDGRGCAVEVILNMVTGGYVIHAWSARSD